MLTFGLLTSETPSDSVVFCFDGHHANGAEMNKMVEQGIVHRRVFKPDSRRRMFVNKIQVFEACGSDNIVRVIA